jgi:carbon-monoxide dehydrogenase large subunit
MREYGIGQSVPRVEDRRLLTGLGRYTDDRRVAGTAHMAVVRSPHAAARVTAIDVAAAAGMPGVLAVLTADDAEADGLGAISCSVKRRQRNGEPMVEPPFPLLAREAVNMVGVAVAIVVAETVDVRYDVLPAATDTGSALDPGTAQVWDDVADNESFYFTLAKN